MAQNEAIRRYLDTGVQFTQMTQARAEAIVKDLVKAGELQTEQAQAAVSDLLDRSRRNADKFVEQVRKEVRSQVSNLGLATQDDIARLERKIASMSSSSRKAPAKKAATRKAPARKAAAKRTAATKSAAKKSAAKKSGA